MNSKSIFQIIVAIASLISFSSCNSCNPLERERAIKELSQKVALVKSFTANAVEKMAAEDGGNPSEIKSKWYYRVPGRFRSEQSIVEDGENITRLIVSDGRDTWIAVGTYVVKSKKMMISKLLLSEGNIAENEKMLGQMKYMGRSSLDGVAIYDFDVNADEGGESPIDRVRTSFGAADGVPRRLTSFDKKGEIKMDVVLSDVQLNVQLEDSLFKYSPPKDATIQEME